MRFLVIVILANLAGCYQGHHWDLDKPFASLEIRTDLIVAADAQNAFIAGLAQLGAHVSATGTQRIALDYDANCTGRGAHTTIGPSVIHLCSAALSHVQTTVLHELLHALWLGYHLSCGAGVMAASLDCEPDPYHYSDADINALCSAGGVAGGICG